MGPRDLPKPIETRVTIPGDNPIRRPEEDALGRATIARTFSQQVLALDATEGVVVGVLGAWGSGKTSFVNLARVEFERASVPILDFNPWMFSGTEQLVESFFVELAAQLKIRPGLAEVGKDLEDFGETFSGMGWLPLVGPWIERGRGAAKLLGKLLERRKEGVGGRRAKLANALATLRTPILIVLDDIDRLSTSEIRDVFRLVRLTASFPNVIYILSFDRVRVEGALAEQGVAGRDYLEKILQVAIDLPAIPDDVLIQQIASAVDTGLTEIPTPGPFNKDVWPDLFMEIIRPLLRNMRDVRRYAAAIHGTVNALEGQIALADVLALEAIRVFLPDVFGRLHAALDSLTATSGLRAGDRDESLLKAQVEGLITAAGPFGHVVQAMVRRLFPAAERHIGGSHYGAEWKARWLKERRVAHEDILRLFLERAVGAGLVSFARAERAWAQMADRESLDGYLRSLDPAQLEDVIASLEVFEDQFRSEHVVPATIVLLNLLPDLPERQRGMFDFGARLVVTRVTYRLVRSLKAPAAVEAAVREILPQVTSLSSKLELIGDVGYRESAGHKLVSEAAAADLESAWREEVRSARADRLIKERDLFRVLLLAKLNAEPSERQLTIDDLPELTLAILRGARSDTISQTMGSRAVRRSPRLAWEELVQLFGDEATLRKRVENARANAPSDAGDLLELAGKYLSGWRPGRDDE